MKNKIIKAKQKQKTMKHAIQILGLIVMAIFITIACKKKKPAEPTNDTEVITTVELTFKDSASTNSIVAVWEDIDGDGGNLPNRQDSILLDSGKTYLMEVRLLDKTKNPVEVISDAVKAEAADHQFYFNLTPNSGVTAFITDADANSLPLGLNSKWRIAKKQTQTKKVFNIVLKHKPGIKKAGDLVSIGDTDIDIDMPMRIK
jgi:hypothetical protein